MNHFFNNEESVFSEIMNDDAEFFPLLSSEDEEKLEEEKIPDSLPILPLRNTVLFPGVLIPITVSREKSINLVRDAYKTDKTIGVVAQKDANIEDPTFEDLNRVGTVAHIIKILQMPDNTTTVIIQGKKRFQLVEMITNKPYLKAKIKTLKSSSAETDDQDFQALVSSIKDVALQIIKLSPNIPQEASFAVKNIESPSFLINFISSNLNSDVLEKQKMLELPDLKERAQLALTNMSKDLQYLELKNQIQDKVRVDLDKQQREYFLNQQLKTIQEELGGNTHEQQIGEMLEKAKSKKWDPKIEEAFAKEITKLKRMHNAAAEYSIQMNYLETLLDLPWNEFTKDNFDINHAQEILDEDHYGLEKVKDRIIEHIAVLKLKGDMKSPILCLVGPPGVGKTSLGKSIARSLERSYVRISLGGMRDEAEIRGHRKTYIGALPGRIIQNLKKAKSSNPVFILDEIDKVGSNSAQGDPSSALLEVLDPEQNVAFYDNFLELDYDLSKVMFIATANTLSTIHPALRDRMEIIDLSGYIIEEKIEIAIRHLIPKQLEEHGVKKNQVQFSSKAIERIIDDYTRESGVRELAKKISKVIRYGAKNIVVDEKYKLKVEPSKLQAILGLPIFQKDNDNRINVPGIITGLAWTSVGGEILFIEASLSKGKGNLTITGNLGDVMKESATLAHEFIKSHAELLTIKQESLENWNIHIHVPEGATPKDGPSAGITMFTALVSAFTQRCSKPRIAMTGEITLRGRVLPVGGIKEKILAAKRANITDIILSEENKKDILDINKIYLEGLSFHYIRNMIDVIDLALVKKVTRKK